MNKKRGRLINQDTFQQLVASYELMNSIDLMSKSREQRIVIPRQCLLYILHKKYNQTVIHLGKLADKNHATILHSSKVVQKEMAWRNMKYLDAVNNWAEIFDEVMPKNEETIKDMTDKIVNILTGTMLSESSKKKVLTEVRKKISKHSVDYSNLVVI